MRIADACVQADAAHIVANELLLCSPEAQEVWDTALGGHEASELSYRSKS